MTAIYDTMQFLKPDIQTVCLGQAASAAAVLLAAGTPGKRMALPNSRILIHQPYTEGSYGQSSDIEIQANEILRMRELLEKLIANHTGQDAGGGQRRHRAGQDPDLGGGRGVRPDRRRSWSRSRGPPPRSEGPSCSWSHVGARRGTFEFGQRRCTPSVGAEPPRGRSVHLSATGLSREESCLWHASVTVATC